jgi:DNA-binding NarL/FixJ family response regulator
LDGSIPREVSAVSTPLPLLVQARDPVSQAGVVAQLNDWPEVRVVADPHEADVAIVVTDEVDEETVRVLKSLQRKGCERVVLVATRIDDAGLVAAVEAGACGLLRRAEATPAALVEAVRLASVGDGSVPPDLLGRLLRQVGRLQRQVLVPRGLSFAGLSEREIDVLRLVADGLDTSEIARHLSYSERTIKNVIHDVTTRLQLRNRSQAVAYAMREGLI